MNKTTIIAIEVEYDGFDKFSDHEPFTSTILIDGNEYLTHEERESLGDILKPVIALCMTARIRKRDRLNEIYKES
jgi:hypothetical protein